MILKPNRLSNGVGIFRCAGPPEFIEHVRLLQMLKADYLLQDFVPHSGDLRIFLSRDTLFGHKFGDLRKGTFAVAARIIARLRWQRRWKSGVCGSPIAATLITSRSTGW